MTDEPIRCWPTPDPAYIAYHNEEWGRPVRDEGALYERPCLEGCDGKVVVELPEEGGRTAGCRPASSSLATER